MAPPMDGLIDDARLRGTEVKLAAAARSGGVTTAITNAERVGTSICDNKARTSSKHKTQNKFGVNAAIINKMLEGMCVNTMVLSKPIRLATQGAASCEKAVNNPAQKKKWPAEMRE